jgi:hypothetical protein
VIANSIAYFGKYSLDEASMVLSLDIQTSTFANLTGNPSEKRNVTSLTDSEFKFNRPFVNARGRLQASRISAPNEVRFCVGFRMPAA